MAASKTNTVSAAKIEAIVAFVRKFTTENDRGCPAGAIEYVGGFSKAEIKAAKASGKLESGKGNEGGFFVAGMKPEAKGPVVKATVKNQMAAFISALKVGQTITQDDVETIEALMTAYEAQNAKRRKQ